MKQSENPEKCMYRHLYSLTNLEYDAFVANSTYYKLIK